MRDSPSSPQMLGVVVQNPSRGVRASLLAKDCAQGLECLLGCQASLRREGKSAMYGCHGHEAEFLTVRRKSHIHMSLG